MSAVSGLQLINQLHISDPDEYEVLTIHSDDSNLSEELSALPDDYSSVVQGLFGQGFNTVWIPNVTLSVTGSDGQTWNGMVYLAQYDPSPGYATAFFETDSVSGSYSGTFTPVHGNFSTGDPNAAPTIPASSNQPKTKEPVNEATGAYTREETDISIPNVGLPLDFTRYYNSGSTADIGFGVGWTDSYSDTMVKQTDNNDVIWTDSQGLSTPSPGHWWRIYRSPGVFGTLTASDGRVHVPRDRRHHVAFRCRPAS